MQVNSKKVKERGIPDLRRQFLSRKKTREKESVIPNYNEQDATFLDLFISTDDLHVSGGSSAHQQEHVTLHTALGIAKQYCCILPSWMRQNILSFMYSYVLLMMGGVTA